jgi:hypothetical protein
MWNIAFGLQEIGLNSFQNGFDPGKLQLVG